VSSAEQTPHPKSSEIDPPAADGPVEEGQGSPPQPAPELTDAAGRAANEPSLARVKVVPEAPQVPAGKPDGEVDTAG